jgi:hypothetical protein
MLRDSSAILILGLKLMAAVKKSSSVEPGNDLEFSAASEYAEQSPNTPAQK